MYLFTYSALEMSSKRTKIVACIFFAILSFVYIFYTVDRDKFYSTTYVIYLNETENNIECYSVSKGDALPSAEDNNFAPPPNSIFFHETSCKGGLNSRQACSIESAARANPERQIIVMFSAPVTSYILKNSCMAKLQEFGNIYFFRLHVTKYAKGTPLESKLSYGKIIQSKYKMENTANMLRYLTLYKYGGVYLDTDIIVVKSLASLGNNWAAREDDLNVNNAVLAISGDPIGRKVVKSIINDVSASFKPNLWGYNGPKAVTRNLNAICNTTKAKDMNAAKCHGFQVYEPKFIYPVYYNKKDVYFKPGELDEKVTKDAYIHHLWNHLSYKLKVEEGSPFQKLAAKYCPTIYEIYGKDFGS